MFYFSPSAFENILKPEYYDHMILYVLFMRLLCQDNFSKNDLSDARYEILYGDENCTYKLHAHSHLINQDISYGPLNKISCFPFEGKIREF
jgi:hypothetical protein